MKNPAADSGKEKFSRGRYWCFVENLQECAGENGEVILHFALPIDHLGQRIENIRITPEPADLIEDAVNGNRFIIWKRSGAEKERALVFYFDFDMYHSEVNVPLDPARVEPYDTSSPEYLRNIISEGWLDISREVRLKAAEIAGNETNPCLKARAIYNWLAANLRYEYIEPAGRGATKTLKRLKGDCGEFSALFVAMCRSLSIPARTVTSNWMSSGGHQWAEFLLPPYGWVPVDATVANSFLSDPDSTVCQLLKELGGFSSSDPDWFFGNLYSDRIIVQIGENVDLSSSKAGVSDAKFYLLQPGGQEAIPSAAEFRGFSRPAVQCGTYVFGDSREDEAGARRKLHQSFGEEFLRIKAYGRAVAELESSLKDNPKPGYTWYLLGQAQFGIKDYPAAISSFSRTISGAGGSLKPVWDAMAHYRAGNCYDLLGERDRAMDEYKLVLASGISFENLQEKVKDCMARPYLEAAA